MGRHTYNLADSDHTGAADAGDNDTVAAINSLSLRDRQILNRIGAVRLNRRFLFKRRAFEADERRTEPVQATEVLIAGGLINHPFAPQGGFQRADGNTIGLDRTVAATLADGSIDVNSGIGLGELPTPPPPSFFGGANLVIYDDRDALDPAELLLDGIQLVPMVDGYTRRKPHI